MKPTTLLLLASLVANVALFGLFYSARTRSLAAGAAVKSSANVTPAARDKSADSARVASDSARDAALGRAFARFAEKLRAAQAASAGGGKWWRNRVGNGDLSREQMAQARRELSDAMIAAFGDDLGIGGDNGKLEFLPTEKRQKLRNILADYDELEGKYRGLGGIQLASDKKEMKLLQTERTRDIAALLSAEELAEYEMRTSATTSTIRNRYGDGIATEEDFKKIYALQKAFDDKFSPENFNGRLTPEMMTARADATQQLQADLRAAIGDDAYAALKRAADSDLRQVDALAARLNLAPDTTDRVAATRDSYAAESQRIMADTSMPFPQRREQVQALAARAKSDLAATLGAEAADAYAQRSSWVSMLQSGMGYSTTPPVTSAGGLALSGNIGQSVFPVMPAGVAGSGTRQTVNFVGSQITTDRPVSFSSDGNFIIGGTPSTAGTQVYSVSTTVSSDSRTTSDASGATTVTKVITVGSPADAVSPPPATPPKP